MSKIACYDGLMNFNIIILYTILRWCDSHENFKYNSKPYKMENKKATMANII